MNRRSVVVTVVVCVLVALGAGAAIGLLVAPAPVPGVVAQGTGDPVVAVTAQPFTDQISVEVVAQVAAQRQIRSAATGVVRATSCVPGKPIASGQPVMTVNDQVVIGLYLATPPWRDLAKGMKGADVADFQRELNRLGHKVSVTGTYGADTAKQAAAMWAAAGVANLTGLPLSRIVWLPDTSETPVSCAQQVGDSIGGGEVFTVGGQLRSLTLTLPDGSLPGDRVATLSPGVSAPVGDDGVVNDAAFLDAFSQTRGYTQWVADNSNTLRVTVELATPEQVVAVPPSSLYLIQGANACLVDGGGKPVAVAIVGSQLGQTFVTASPLPTSVTVTAPEDAPSCG